MWRETPLSAVKIVKMKPKEGDVLQLRLSKPKYYNGYVTSGMYGFLNIPQVSRTEWHPFTLTSGESNTYFFKCTLHK